jgi:alpha-1,6-mannosyltransferase
VLDATEWFGETSGGIRTYLREKSRFVAARPHLRQSIVVPGDQDAISDESGVRMFRLRGPAIPRHKPYRVMLSWRSLARIVRHERPHIIEVGSPFMVPWLLSPEARRLGIPMVSFHHTDVAGVLSRVIGGSATTQRRLSKATWVYLRQLDRLFSTTIVATRGGADELRREGIERVEHVPLGVDLTIFTSARRHGRDATRLAHGLPDGPLAGYVGRFAREKELHVVLDGWAQVERATGARLVLVGAGPEEARLRAHPYGSRVLFVPYLQERDALADLLAALDVYIAPGPAETFGLSAVEAMACGTPILSAHRGAVAEHVLRSGGGLTYEAGNASAMTTQGIQIFDADLSRLGASAERFAITEHGWPTVLEQLFAVYQRVVDRRES